MVKGSSGLFHPAGRKTGFGNAMISESVMPFPLKHMVSFRDQKGNNWFCHNFLIIFFCWKTFCKRVSDIYLGRSDIISFAEIRHKNLTSIYMCLGARWNSTSFSSPDCWPNLSPSGWLPCTKLVWIAHFSLNCAWKTQVFKAILAVLWIVFTHHL